MLKPQRLFVASSECSLVAVADGTWRDSTLWLAIIPPARLWQCLAPMHSMTAIWSPHIIAACSISLCITSEGARWRKYGLSAPPSGLPELAKVAARTAENANIQSWELDNADTSIWMECCGVGGGLHADAHIACMASTGRNRANAQHKALHIYIYTYIIYQKSNLIISGVQHVSLSANLDCNVADLLLRFLAPATDDFDQAKSNERSGNASCCDMLWHITVRFRPLHCNASMLSISWWGHLRPPKHCE